MKIFRRFLESAFIAFLYSSTMNFISYNLGRFSAHETKHFFEIIEMFLFSEFLPFGKIYCGQHLTKKQLGRPLKTARAHQLVRRVSLEQRHCKHAVLDPFS
jgi:hypothetical protein